MKEQLNELQIALLEMLEWFDHFCRENSLRYYVLGGTMLGAARHKGFIPWDDDIDVGMPRSDYNKLSLLMNKYENSHYILETPYTTNDDFCYPISKLYDTRTTLIEHKRYNVKRGIFIDIFPLDGTGDTEKESNKICSKIQFKYNLYLSRVVGVNSKRSRLKNIAAVILGSVPNFLIDNRKLRISIDKACQKKEFDTCRWGGNLLGAWRNKEIMPIEIMGNPTEYQFESIVVYGVEKYDEYLTRLYGDWRKLPPKENRITHHDFESFDLKKSYLL